MSEHLSDDKIEAVVTVVLQAVDQRLAAVRDQLVQLTNTIARGHAELQGQIDDVRRQQGASPAPNGQLLAGTDAAAALQLVEAANVLTERVTFLEARVNQYTNDRVAELHTAIERLNSQLAEPAPAVPPGAVMPVPSRTAAGFDPVPDGPARSVAPAPVFAPSVAIPVADADGSDNIAPAAARLPHLGATPRSATGSASGPAVAATVEPIDIEQLSAQMSERLSAAIERALGT